MMAVPIGDFPASVQALLQERADRYAALAERGDAARRMGEALSSLHGEASSPRREVHVTLTGSGLLDDVHFSSAAMGLGAAGLSRLTLLTIRQAMEDLEEKVDSAAQESGGGVADTVAESIRSALGRAVSQLPDDKDR
jgi:DNA-binding protein YbaB